VKTGADVQDVQTERRNNYEQRNRIQEQSRDHARAG